MSYKTLAQLEAEIRYRYDVESFTARHPQANVFSLINDAYRTLRERLTSDGSNVFVSCVEATVTGAGRTSGYPGTLLQAHAFDTFTIVNEVHVLYGISWRPLQHVSLADVLTRDDGSGTAVPDSWCMAGLNWESTTGTVPGSQGVNILVCPSLDNLRTFRVVGLQGWTTLTAATDSIAIDLGFNEFLLAYVGLKIAARDDDVKLHDARAAELEETYRDLRRRSLRREPMSTQRIDVRNRGGWRAP